jgi:hypothetical protein
MRYIWFRSYLHSKLICATIHNLKIRMTFLDLLFRKKERMLSEHNSVDSFLKLGLNVFLQSYMSLRYVIIIFDMLDTSNKTIAKFLFFLLKSNE